jgi:hypothetical protein
MRALPRTYLTVTAGRAIWLMFDDDAGLPFSAPTTPNHRPATRATRGAHASASASLPLRQYSSFLSPLMLRCFVVLEFSFKLYILLFERNHVREQD